MEVLLEVTANPEADEIKIVLEAEHQYGKILNAKRRLKGGR